MNCLKRLKSLFILLIYLVAYAFIITVFKIGCPIKFLTGVSCAGCGMSRAWISLLSFDIKIAIYYHPLFWVPPVAVIVYVFADYIKPSVIRALSVAAICLFMSVYLYRVLVIHDPIVLIDIHDGLIYRVIKYIGDML